MNNIQILWVARSYSLPQAGVKEHTHPYYHMFYVTEGICKFIADGKKYKLSQGKGVLVPKDTIHSFSTSSKSPATYLEIKFTIKKNDFDMRLSKSIISFENNKLVDALIERILNEYSEQCTLSDYAATSYLQAVLNLITEKERQSESSAYRFIDASGFSPLSQKIIKYLEENYAKATSLDELSASLGYNKSYLCSAFKDDTQTTILDCLNTIRVRRAAQLITYSEQSLSHVAKLCGFSSVSHFTRVFQKHVGITPGQIRRAYPFEILMGNDIKKQELANKPDRFMYSVLARKNFTFSEIYSFENSNEEN